MRICLIAMILGTAILGTAIPASAQQDRGRLHFQAGASYYEAGDYEDALREFQRAYELSQKPELFYNLSLCHQQLGDLNQASSFLQQYLENVAEIPNRANLERRLENFQRRISDQTSGDGGDGADGGDTGDGVSGSDIYGDGAEGSDAGDTTGDDTGDDGTGGDVDAGGGANVPAIIGFSVAGAGALMLGISGGLAMSKRSELDDDGCSPCPSSDVSSLRRRAVFADVGLGLTAVGAVLGVVFLIVGGGDDDDAEARRVRVEPYAGRQGAGASLSGRF